MAILDITYSGKLLKKAYIFKIVLHKGQPLLWPSGQSSWLQMQRSGFGSWLYQIFWEVVGLERGSLSLMSKTEELLERKSSGSGIEGRKYGRGDPSGWPSETLYLQRFETNFANKRRFLGRYSSLADWGHGVCLFRLFVSYKTVCQWQSINSLHLIRWIPTGYT
jgi:hypothetical protein